jgi:hypothetical protein
MIILLSKGHVNVVLFNSTVNGEKNLVATEEVSCFPNKIINANISYLDFKAWHNLRLTSQICQDYITVNKDATESRSRN